MKIIRSARVFNAELPDIEDMSVHLGELPFSPLGKEFRHNSSFVPNPITGELVTPIPSGYTFTCRHDEKILPVASVRLAIKEAVELKMEELGRELTADEQGELDDIVTADLIAKALIKTTLIHCFYHVETNFLVVATTSKVMTMIVTGMLLKCCGSIKTTTIHIDNLKGGLTTKLYDHINLGESAFGELITDSYFLLKDKQSKATFDHLSDSSAHNGLREALEQGMQVEAIGFIHGTLAFRLDKDFVMKRLVFFGELTEEQEAEREDYDRPMMWRVEAGAQLVELVATLQELCKLFEYAPPKPEDKDSQ